jgi:hypothetical protein
LRAAGIQPDEAITDDSRLYPSALAEIWPTAVHQLCSFHATRRVRFGIWKDDSGQRRTPADAEQRYHAWQADAEAATVAPLRRQLQHLDADHFTRLSAFRREPTWESTNNPAERGARAFRHGQHPHFRLRSATTSDADLKVRAHLQHTASAHLHRSASITASAAGVCTGRSYGVNPFDAPNANSALSLPLYEFRRNAQWCENTD